MLSSAAMRIPFGVVALFVVGACDSKEAPAPVASETPTPVVKEEPKPAPPVASAEVAGPAAPAPVAGPQADPNKKALEQAKAAGILGSTALTQGGAFASLTGTGDISSGLDDKDIYGGLVGNEPGDMQGGFGYGKAGFGPGGGGTGWGTIGTGKYGTIGKGSGTGSGYGVGGGRGGMRGRAACVPTVSIGQPTSQGDLDKAIIRRYIKRNIQKLQYCYEKQLIATPGLSGTVATQFFITPEGNVTNVIAKGVHTEVSSCITNVIQGIQFPKPKGGGGVQVSYPFTFRPSC